jgi:hypothetical protein
VLKDRVELHLDKGAVLLASTRHEDFPTFRPEYKSLVGINGFHALIYAEKAAEIAITGEGTIDGQGARQRRRKGKQWVSDRDGRPRNILLVSCRKIRVQGITMRNSGVWNQHYLDCEDVVVDGVTVFNHSNRNNDGIDIEFPGGGTKKDAERKVPEKPGAYPQPTFWGKLPAFGFFIRNVEGLAMKDMKLKTLKPDARKAVVEE